MGYGIVRTAWAGTSGGPGVTQLHIAEAAETFWTDAAAQIAVNAVRAFWEANKAVLPDDVTLTVSPVVDLYHTEEAELYGSVNAATPPASVTGTGAGVFTMAAGVKVNLNTNTVRNGRRVRGSIFMVPAVATAYTNAGVVAAGIRTTINTSGATLLAALTAADLGLSVYSRPQTSPAVRVGALAPVISLEGNEKSCILRGRRD